VHPSLRQSEGRLGGQHPSWWQSDSGLSWQNWHPSHWQFDGHLYQQNRNSLLLSIFKNNEKKSLYFIFIFIVF
jgi:hypothetical protein